MLKQNARIYLKINVVMQIFNFQKVMITIFHKKFST